MLQLNTIQAQNSSDSLFTNGILTRGVADGAWQIYSANHAVCCLSLPEYVMSLRAWQFLPGVSKRLYDSNISLQARGLRLCHKGLVSSTTSELNPLLGQIKAQEMADLLPTHVVQAQLRTVTTCFFRRTFFSRSRHLQPCNAWYK